MSCIWKIRLSPNKNQESQIQKMCWKKLHKHKSFVSCKELLFSLGNYVWDEKWPYFIILSLIWKLSIVTLLSLINFLLYPNQESPSTLGGKGKEKFSLKLKRSNTWCWKANVKKWSSKGVELAPLKEYKWAKAKQ